jgi:hypothetical protein
MNTVEKLSGGIGTVLAKGATEVTMPTNTTAYAMLVRADATAVATITEIIAGVETDNDDGYTWIGEALLKDDFIVFTYPVTAITLTNAGDIVILYLAPLSDSPIIPVA